MAEIPGVELFQAIFELGAGGPADGFFKFFGIGVGLVDFGWRPGVILRDRVFTDNLAEGLDEVVDGDGLVIAEVVDFVGGGC